MYGDTWIFDIISNTWTEVGVNGIAPSPRHHHAAAVLADVMWIFGGQDGNKRLLTDLYSFDLKCRTSDSLFLILVNQWSRIDTHTAPGRIGHCLFGYGTNIIILGGSDKENAAYIRDVSPEYRGPGERKGSDTIRAQRVPLEPTENSDDGTRGDRISRSAALQQFLEENCLPLMYRWKRKNTADTKSLHWLIGENTTIQFVSLIASGASGEVYQVPFLNVYLNLILTVDV